MKMNKLILEEFYLLRYNAMQPTESQQTFQSNTSPPSSRLKGKSNKKHMEQGRASRALAYSSTLNMEVTCSFETSADFLRSTRQNSS
jgi:hypothetical protein